MQLDVWNQLEGRVARELIEPCVAIREWSVQLSSRRPYASYEALLDMAMALMDDWDEDVLDRALSKHPRIGQKLAQDGIEADFSRQEQAAVSQEQALTAALSEANRCYEQRFGRVFLIRAKGRSGEQILTELKRRIQLSQDDELIEALKALKSITLLRLEALIEA